MMMYTEQEEKYQSTLERLRKSREAWIEASEAELACDSDGERLPAYYELCKADRKQRTGKVVEFEGETWKVHCVKDRSYGWDVSYERVRDGAKVADERPNHMESVGSKPNRKARGCSVETWLSEHPDYVAKREFQEEMYPDGVWNSSDRELANALNNRRRLLKPL